MDIWSQLPPEIKKKLEKDNLTDSEKLLTTSAVILKSYGLEQKDVQLMKSVISQKYQNRFLRASECATKEPNKWKRLTFGCTSLDKIMKNGVSNRGITEISGEAGTGKSQICLQLSLTVQLAEENGGFGKGVAYICTEDAFPSKRLYQMSQKFLRRYGQHSFLDKIFIEHITESDKLLECLSVRLPQLCRQEPIGLIVIDSVAAIYRVETNAIDRAMDMRKLAQALQILSYEHGCVVICVNQVSSVIDDTGLNKVVPCLGLAWSNLVTTRIQIHRKREIPLLSHTQELGEPSTQFPSTVRGFEIIFSPELPQCSADFRITEDGVVDL